MIPLSRVIILGTVFWKRYGLCKQNGLHPVFERHQQNLVFGHEQRIGRRF